MAVIQLAVGWLVVTVTVTRCWQSCPENIIHFVRIIHLSSIVSFSLPPHTHNHIPKTPRYRVVNKPLNQHKNVAIASLGGKNHILELSLQPMLHTDRNVEVLRPHCDCISA